MKLRILPLLFAFLLVSSGAFAQHDTPAETHESAQPAARGEHKDKQPGEHAPNDNIHQATTEGELAEASQAAGGDPHAEYKESAMVKALGSKLGLSPSAASLLFFFLNFLMIAGLLYWVARKFNLAGALRERGVAIRRQIDEARRASEEANRRLADIEARLSRLDSEISAMHATAEADAAAEEQRIRAAAQQDAGKVVTAAQAEIDAAARHARRELKAYAADLAVALAEKRIQIDPATDQALLRTFVDELGKDGK